MESTVQDSETEVQNIALLVDLLKVDTLKWLPIHRNCLKYFLDIAQHASNVQSLAAFVNILLPRQRAFDPILHFSEPTIRSQTGNGSIPQLRCGSMSLVPYIRRLVVTGIDTPAVMQVLFGDEWFAGVGPLHSHERVNYLFAAKSGGWLKTKVYYDLPPYETVPFMHPLRDPQEEELRAADARWSQWLAMEDWMVGPRSFSEQEIDLSAVSGL